jgi:hypothetical protein
VDQELKFISSPFGVDEDRDMNTDQSANQQDAEGGTPRAKEKVEEVSGSPRIKVEPGTQSLVITAEVCRKFLAENTGLGKNSINATDEREYTRILQKQFTKNLELTEHH